MGVFGREKKEEERGEGQLRYFWDGPGRGRIGHQRVGFMEDSRGLSTGSE